MPNRFTLSRIYDILDLSNIKEDLMEPISDLYAGWVMGVVAVLLIAYVVFGVDAVIEWRRRRREEVGDGS